MHQVNFSMTRNHSFYKNFHLYPERLQNELRAEETYYPAMLVKSLAITSHFVEKSHIKMLVRLVLRRCLAMEELSDRLPILR